MPHRLVSLAVSLPVGQVVSQQHILMTLNLYHGHLQHYMALLSMNAVMISSITVVAKKEEDKMQCMDTTVMSLVCNWLLTCNFFNT